MATVRYEKCEVTAIATAVPPILRKTADFTDWIGEENVAKIEKNVGIREGYISPENMTTSDLCFAAAERIFQGAEIDRSSIDALIFVSQTPDYVAPSTACLLQHRLGLSSDCMAYDINLACSGYVYGLSAAMSYLGENGLKRVLLLAGDTVSKHCSPKDKTLSILSTDAGSATLVEYSSEASSSGFLLRTIGEGYRKLIVPYGGYRHREGSFERTEREQDVFRNDYDGYMDGAEVFKFSITQVPKLIKDHISEFECEEYDAFILHQANKFILSNITKRIKAAPDLVPISIDRYGNTGAATIPLTICDAFAGNKKDLSKVLICGFGIGLSLGAGTINLSNAQIFPIFQSREVFEDNIDDLHKTTSSLIG